MTDERKISKSPLLAAPYRAADPRMPLLIDAARRLIEDLRYDPHFAGLEQSIEIESRLFLARLDACSQYELAQGAPPSSDALTAARAVHDSKYGRDDPVPIAMVLFCPECGWQHVDEPKGSWTNPPHRSHLCARCGWVWRPADVPTVGVSAIRTMGRADSQPSIRGRANYSTATTHWRHEKRGTHYREIGRGELQVSELGHRFVEGVRLVAYQGDDGRMWFRQEDEFLDGRFTQVTP